MLPPGVSTKEGTQVTLTLALEGSVADYDDTWRGEMEAWVYVKKQGGTDLGQLGSPEAAFQRQIVPQAAQILG